MKVVSLTKLGLDTLRRAQSINSDELKVLKYLEEHDYRSTEDNIEIAVSNGRVACRKLSNDRLVVYLNA